MKKILVSGFGSFQEFGQNPSADVVAAVEKKQTRNVTFETIVLPVSWNEAWPLLKEKCETFQPDVWLGLGLAPGPFIRLETTARNAIEMEMDIHGQWSPQGGETYIVANAPETLPTQLPLKLINQAINRHYAQLPRAKVILSSYSHNAGAYLCNYVFYNMLHHFGQEIAVQGFIHLPAYPIHEGQFPYEGEDIVNIGVFLVQKVAELGESI